MGAWPLRAADRGRAVHRRLNGASHIVHIDDKTGVSTHADAAVLATEHGLPGGE